MAEKSLEYDIIIIGGGQSGLAVGYYLRRTQATFLILDGQESPGGAWQHTWDSLRLFSPAQWSSLPGMIMPGGKEDYPHRDEVIDYLRAYEKKYVFPVRRPVQVKAVSKKGGLFHLDTNQGSFRAKALVSTTGTWSKPWMPKLPRLESFKGTILHSAQYKNPKDFKGKKLAILGEGNSGAQILAELSKEAETYWITQKPPTFLPDHVDGRYLFDVATQMYEAKKQGKSFQSPNLGDVVMVPPVKEARERGVLKAFAPIRSMDSGGAQLEDGRYLALDALLFCTGFRPALDHLQPLWDDLGTKEPNVKELTEGARCTALPGLWLVGYGSWTGFASATLIGVGRSAREACKQLEAYLKDS